MAYLGRPGATAPLSSADIPDNSITAAKIVDATIAAGDLANDVVISTSGAITTTGAFTSVGIDDNADANAITIDANESVGIGVTPSASYSLDVKNSLSVQGAEGVSAALYLRADEGDDNGDTWRIISNHNVNDLTLSNNTSGSYVDKITFLKTGEVGIGIDAPLANLHVEEANNGAVSELLRLDNSGSGANTGEQLSFHNSGERGYIQNKYRDATYAYCTDINGSSVVVQTGGTDRMIIRPNGNVAIGDASHDARRFSIKGTASDNSENMIECINSSSVSIFKMLSNGLCLIQANTGGLGQGIAIEHAGNDSNRQGIQIKCGTNDGSGTNYDMEFYAVNGTVQGSITHSSGTVSYNAFTAGHDAELPDADNDSGYPYGTLVEQTGIFYSKDIDGNDNQRGILYKAQKTSSAYSKSVLGAYSSKHQVRPAVSEVLYVEGDELPDGKSIGDVKIEATETSHENLHQVYVLGDGHIICNGEKGSISVGDGICTSSTDGEGMKADKTAMIIGFAQENVSFSGSESKLVVVQYGLRQFTPWDE